MHVCLLGCEHENIYGPALVRSLSGDSFHDWIRSSGECSGCGVDESAVGSPALASLRRDGKTQRISNRQAGFPRVRSTLGLSELVSPVLFKWFS